MILASEKYTLVFGDENGMLSEFSTGGKNFIYNSKTDYPLFSLRLRDA